MDEHAPSNGLTDGDAPGPDAPADARVNPAALPVSYAAKLLSRAAGRQITEEMLSADIEDGAPTNADGTINLVHYAAWLVREMSNSATGGGRGD